ncbi:MAG: adenylate/guanylate cyclase domain-containing protein [Ignavibacteriaceae bacterium]
MLAAIMFTDIVGYTAMMQEDESKAISLRNRNRQVLEDYSLVHQGKVLQYFGDGSLIMFGSVIEAVICAIEIQLELKKEPVVPLRIGIHAGDIVYDDDGIYGDSVNLASRIETLGVGGSILISNRVNDELKNHRELPTYYIGTYELKNVRTPTDVYAIELPGIVIPKPNEIDGKIAGKKESIAVLPFINMSSDSENEYFSEGITEEILNALARVDGLLVTSRTSSFAFKGKNSDIREIGRQLGVKTVLEGSVRKIGNKVRVTAQLIDTRNGYHRWSESYDRDIADIFEMQDEIAKSITNKLKESFSLTTDNVQMVKTPTENMEAYNLYLKASYYWYRWTPADIKKSLELLKKTIKLDPGFALAYSSLSACYVYLGAMGQLPALEVYPLAKNYALKAISLDDSLPDCHVSLAMVHFFEWQWDESYKSFMKALSLNPNSAEAHLYYSYYQVAMGNLKKAILENEKALEIDPLNVQINCSLADTYLFAGLFNEALEQYKKSLELDSTYRSAIYGLGWVYYYLDELEKSLQQFKRAQTFIGDDSKGQTTLGFIYARLGMMDEVEKCLNRLDERNKVEKDVSLTMDYAIIYSGLKDYDKAFFYLEKAFEEKSGGLVFLRTRHWKEVQDDPRYTNILTKMNLPLN